MSVFSCGLSLPVRARPAEGVFLCSLGENSEITGETGRSVEGRDQGSSLARSTSRNGRLRAITQFLRLRMNPTNLNEELYETAHKFLTKKGHKITFKFSQTTRGRSPEVKLDVDGTEMNRQQLIALAATYSGWKYLKG